MEVPGDGWYSGQETCARWARPNVLWQRPCGTAPLQAAAELVKLRAVRGVVRQRELRVLHFWAANRCLERAIILRKRAKFRVGVLATKPTLTAALRRVVGGPTETETGGRCEGLVELFS